MHTLSKSIHRDIHQLQNFAQLSHTLNQSLPFIQIIPPTSLNIEVNKNHLWNKSQDLILTPHKDNPPPLPLYPNNLPYKFPIQYSYFIDGSFYPHVEISPGIWQAETASYDIYNAHKNLRISKRLPGLQNILRADLIAILETIIYNNSICPHEPSHIFTDSLNSIYLIKLQIIHLSQHNNHLHKTILSEIVTQLQHQIQPLTIYKVRAHSGIHSNEIADELAKDGRHLIHSPPSFQYEHAHSTPYYLHKDKWKRNMVRTLYKGSIRHLQRYFIKHTNETYLKDTAIFFPNIDKWTSDENIDQITSNNLWTNQDISEAQIKQLIKFCTGQYMGNAQKHLFWPNQYPNPNCTLCNINTRDTWPHVLLSCPQPHLHVLRV